MSSQQTTRYSKLDPTQIHGGFDSLPLKVDLEET